MPVFFLDSCFVAEAVRPCARGDAGLHVSGSGYGPSRPMNEAKNRKYSTEEPLRSDRFSLDVSSEPPLGRLDGVIDYLTFLVEKGFVSGDSAERVRLAATVLREALREEARKAGEDPSPWEER